MDGRRTRLVDRALLDHLPRLTKSVTTPVRHSERQLAIGWAVILGVGWPLALRAGVALQPVAEEPQAATPFAIQLAVLALNVVLVGTITAAALRHPAAASAGVVTGLIAMAFIVSCPLTGHHGFGLWWVGQLGITAAMLGVSVAALGRRSLTTS